MSTKCALCGSEMGTTANQLCGPCRRVSPELNRLCAEIDRIRHEIKCIIRENTSLRDAMAKIIMSYDYQVDVARGHMLASAIDAGREAMKGIEP